MRAQVLDVCLGLTLSPPLGNRLGSSELVLLDKLVFFSRGTRSQRALSAALVFRRRGMAERGVVGVGGKGGFRRPTRFFSPHPERLPPSLSPRPSPMLRQQLSIDKLSNIVQKHPELPLSPGTKVPVLDPVRLLVV